MNDDDPRELHPPAVRRGATYAFLDLLTAIGREVMPEVAVDLAALGSAAEARDAES